MKRLLKKGLVKQTQDKYLSKMLDHAMHVVNSEKSLMSARNAQEEAQS